MAKLLLFSILFIPLLSMADEYPDSLSRLSIEGGLNYSTFINAEEPGIVSGFTVGLRYDCYLSEKILFSLGFLYSKEGGIIMDIYAVAGYLKFPVTYGYPLYFQNHKEVTLYGGLAFLLPVKDYTSTIHSWETSPQKSLSSSSDKNYTEDPENVSEYGPFKIGDNKNVSIEFGCLFKYKQIMLDVNINYHLLNFGEFGYYHEINKNLLSVKFLFGLFFR